MGAGSGPDSLHGHAQPQLRLKQQQLRLATVTRNRGKLILYPTFWVVTIIFPLLLLPIGD